MKYLIKGFCILLLVMHNVVAFAQYDVEDDDPIVNAAYLNVGANFNSTISADARVHLMNGKLSIDAKYANGSNSLGKYLFSFAGNNVDPVGYQTALNASNIIGGTPILHPNAGLQNKFMAELGGCYYFNRKIVSKPRFFLIAVHSTIDYIYSWYVIREATAYRAFGARFGMVKNRLYYNGRLPNLNDSAQNANTFTPNIYTSPYYNDKSSYFANKYSTYGYIGIQMTKIINVKLTDMGWLERRVINRDYYLDLLYPIANSIDELRFNQDATKYQLTAAKSQIQNFGYRLGTKSRCTRYAKLGMSYEIGSRPGYLNPEFPIMKNIISNLVEDGYIMIGVELSLSSTIKQMDLSTVSE